MSRTILVPFDGSAQSRAALTFAHNLSLDATVVALYVVPPIADRTARHDDSVQYERAFEEARNRLEEAREVVASYSGRFEAEFVYGHPVHEILRYVDRYVVDQVVMGSLGGDDADTLRLGSVAETVVQRSPVPVTVVRSSGGDGSDASPNSVLVPFDGSLPARKALTYALEQFPEAIVMVLYAESPVPTNLDEQGVRGDLSTDFSAWYEQVGDWHDKFDRDPNSVLERAETVAHDYEHDISTRTGAGDPERVILEHVERSDVAHVVVGSHGRDGLTRHLLGSVAQFVVRRSPTPVTVVR